MEINKKAIIIIVGEHKTQELRTIPNKHGIIYQLSYFKNEKKNSNQMVNSWDKQLLFITNLQELPTPSRFVQDFIYLLRMLSIWFSKQLLKLGSIFGIASECTSRG